MSVIIKAGTTGDVMEVDAEGRASVSINNIPNVQFYDRYFEKNLTGSPYGNINTTGVVRLVGAAFVGTTIDANLWVTAVVNSGTVTFANNQGIVRTGGTANSSATLTSFHPARFIPGYANYFRASIRLNSLLYDGTVKKWGLFFSTTDGFYFEYSEGILKLIILKGSSATTVATASFNGELAGFVMDVNVHNYQFSLLHSMVHFINFLF